MTRCPTRTAPRWRAAAAAGLLALSATLLTAGSAAAEPAGCGPLDASTAGTLVDCVGVDAVKAHQAALQAIADANAGTRAAGTPGFTASVDYVKDQAGKAGLTVTTQDFQFPFFQLNSSALAQTAPTAADYVAGQDFAAMSLSGSARVSGTAVPVDLQLPPTGGSTSGCEAADFAGFAAGSIALMQRGTCEFGVKAANAAAAGAVGAVIFNEGNAPDRQDVLQGDLGTPVAIPVVGVSFALGQSLQNATLSLQVDAISELRTSTDVLAELPGEDPSRVLVVGAHLDSVPEGPGINDNGSGSAAVLEVARQLAASKPKATVRFAWWGAEELGLLGSQAYVAALPPAELARIYAYLNFDMIGSPNAANFLYDGDDSDAVGAGPGPTGSAQIEDVLEKFFADRGQATEGTDFDGRSDYGPFIAAGVPAGGTFTGAEGIKTPEQAAKYGGTAGQPYDPCYHQACDTTKNVDDKALELHSDAVAATTAALAFDPGLVTGTAAPAAAPGGGAPGGGFEGARLRS